MKKLIFRFLLLLFFSMTWGLSFGQNFPKPDTINGMVVSHSVFLMHDKRNPENSQMNSTIYSVKSPNKKFNVLDNNPYELNKIKIDPTRDIPYACGKPNINFEYMHRMHPKLALSQNDPFDFLAFSYELVRGTAFTIVAYGLVANVAVDEGENVARKAIYTFAVIDKNNNLKWYRDIIIPTNNFHFSYSKDGKYAVVPGSRIEKETILNHIYLISLEDKKVVYNFLPNNEESLLFDTQSSFHENMRILPTKLKNRETAQYYFDTKTKTLYKRETSNKLCEDTERKYAHESLSDVWNDKTSSFCYYYERDTLRKKKLFEQKYTKIKTIK